ncbi:MAG: right-handed parallel beta-helix repeat-containing protein [Betaproteobacteria bacterium]|nr:right-handed parallel beta-helix repeat-containing protein [Betaproteobacteria bacterium]
MRQLASRILLSILLVLATLPAYAAQRTFVSTAGSDANTASNCANTAPCRGFAAALTVTDSGGEIVALASGGYGPVTIDKSVSIVSPEGVYAGISVTVPAGTAITIATPGIAVALRGLTLNGVATGTRGILMTGGARLSIANCVFTNFSSGLQVTTNARLRVLRSEFRDNHDAAIFSGGATASISESQFYGSTDMAVWVTDYFAGTSVTTSASIDRSVASGGNGGFAAQNINPGNTSKLLVTDSVATKNSASGVQSYTLAGTAYVSVRNSHLADNYIGMDTGGAGATLVASGNGVIGNFYGLLQSASAVLESAADNEVRGNGTAVIGSITTTFPKM